MQDALKAAIEVPLNVVRVGNSCWPHLITLAQHGNISTKSDLQVTIVTNTYHSPLLPCNNLRKHSVQEFHEFLSQLRIAINCVMTVLGMQISCDF